MAMQTEWLECYHVSSGQPLTIQQSYTQDTDEFFNTHTYKTIGLDTQWPLWGVTSGWNLVTPDLKNPKEYFYHHEIRFCEPLYFKSNCIGGIMAKYELDVRRSSNTNIVQIFKSKISSTDVRKKSFDWTDQHVFDDFARNYSNLKVRLQFRYGSKGWFLVGLQFDKIFWDVCDPEPVWIEFE